MNPEQWEQIRQILDQALGKSEADLNAYLDGACAGNEELRRQVELFLDSRRETEAESSPDTRSDELPAPAADLLRDGAAELPSGTRIASYVIEALQGRGGMGIVYRARDEKLRRQVAIKILAPRILNDVDARRRFLTEARALAQISHPNILTIYDVDRSESIVFLAMEWIDGNRLDQLIRGAGLPLGEALKYAVQIADALAYAHAQGIIHRDLKPTNVMITAAGSVKVLDFGLAKLAGRTGGEESTANDTSVTAPGGILGTAAYMSPEQAQGHKVDWRSDVFSFGSMLYEMLSGRRAFGGDSVISTLAAVIKEQPRPLDEKVPARVRAVVERCLRKDPERRFQAMADARVELEEINEARTVGGLPKLKRSLDGRAKAYALAGLVIALLAGFGLWRYWVNPRLPDFEMAQVTSGIAWEGEPEISPDGNWIAFASNASGNLDIYVTDILGHGQRQITNDPADDTHPVWFPDGGAIAFTSNRGGRIAIWRTGAIGGGATVLVENAIDPAISPDNTRIAFARISRGGYRISVAPLDKLAEVKTLTDDPNETVVARNPAWSPDGDWICYEDRQDLWIVNASGGRPRPLTSDGQYNTGPAWSPDGRRIYYSSFLGGARALRQINSAGGTPDRVTGGAAQASHPSVCRDGARLAYATDSKERGIAIIDRRSGAKSFIPGGQWNMPSISRDGTRVVFVSSRPGSNSDLLVQQLKGGIPSGTPEILAGIEGVLSQPAISPDGQWIACYRIFRNKREILNVPFSGRRPIEFTKDPPQSVTPAWSRDGSMIAFAAKTNAGSEICTARVVNGGPAGEFRKIAFSDTFAYAPAWSPDGATLAFVEERNQQGEVWTVSANGDAPARQITKGASASRVRWDPGTGDLLVSGIWGGEKMILRRVSVAGGLASPFEPDVDFGGVRSSGLFDVSDDGKWLVFSREDVSGHVWILKAVKAAF